MKNAASVILCLEQSYIPHLKALMCGINAAEAQRCDCMFTFCYAYPKMGVLLHKMANASHSSSGTVCPFSIIFMKIRGKYAGVSYNKLSVISAF